MRPTLDIAEIDMAVQVIKSQQPGCIVAVDNCYGEFTDTKEPCAVSPSAHLAYVDIFLKICLQTRVSPL